MSSIDDKIYEEIVISRHKYINPCMCVFLPTSAFTSQCVMAQPSLIERGALSVTMEQNHACNQLLWII